MLEKSGVPADIYPVIVNLLFHDSLGCLRGVGLGFDVVEVNRDYCRLFSYREGGEIGEEECF
jgi:hypothetical protein